MAAKNVVDWLLSDAMIDPVTRPMSHGMKLREFILDAGTSISLRHDLPWHDLPSHLYCGMIEVNEMDVDVVALAYIFYLLSTTLFTNHGNDVDLALLPPIQDLDATRQFNWGAAALSYLYYGMGASEERT
ncbi:hypothetical protein JCGZ_00147 [Jatropha curcas]|uniref:Aminotransferase-like plant mobile domain-containing protein n=1 Tax=Jatropha curcas TaxID=180498 RepID=A0A067JIM9_JATCU|nr:hypothetical protein JCGZ_00147 [Jatropha curcas]